MSEEQQTLMYAFFCGFLFVVMIVFIVKVLNNSMQKTKYYKSVIYFETDFGKHKEMLEKQKIILLKKKIQLYFLTFLVGLKEVFKR